MDDRYILCLGLSDEHTVNWITLPGPGNARLECHALRIAKSCKTFAFQLAGRKNPRSRSAAVGNFPSLDS